jgi:SAM-dependent methyltransferase
MRPADLAAAFRAHSRLPAALAGNLDTWLGEPGTLERYQALVPAPRSGETNLLEIGCYQPSVGYYFSLGWRDVVGTFLDEGEGTESTEYSSADGARVRLVMADAETRPLPLPDGWADAVLMMQVWEHFAVDPMRVLWEINRVLKPGGRFMLSTPNGAGWQYVMRILRGQAAWGGMEFTGFSHNRHNRLYDVSELRLIFEQAGFAVTQASTRDFGGEPRDWQSRAFRLALTSLDRAAALLSSRPRERGTTLFIEGTKAGPPRERYPANLYLTEADWPGITSERRRLSGRPE